MKKTFTIVKLGGIEQVVLKAQGGTSPVKAAGKNAIKRTESNGVIAVHVASGHKRQLARHNARIIGTMLADPITESKLSKAGQLIKLAEEASGSDITARFRRAVA